MIYFPFDGFNFSELKVYLIFSRSKKTNLIINKTSLDFLLKTIAILFRQFLQKNRQQHGRFSLP